MLLSFYGRPKVHKRRFFITSEVDASNLKKMLFNTVILLGLLSQVATKNCKIATNNPTFGSTYDLVPSQTKNAASVAAGFNELSVVGKITVVDACTFNFSFKHGDVTGSTTRDAGL